MMESSKALGLMGMLLTVSTSYFISPAVGDGAVAGAVVNDAEFINETWNDFTDPAFSKSVSAGENPANPISWFTDCGVVLEELCNRGFMI